MSSDLQRIEEEKVKVECPSCNKTLRVPPTYSGKIRCPTCAQEILVKASIKLEMDEKVKSVKVGEWKNEKHDDDSKIEISEFDGGFYEFWAGLIIPIIPPIIIFILAFTGILDGNSSPNLIGLIYFMCSLCCWPVIGFGIVYSSKTFVVKFRDGARFSIILSLIIGGLIWIWFFSLISGGITN